MKNKLNYLSERQSVLAQNIANADTPGYKARDIESPDFKRMLKEASHGPAHPLRMTATHAGHMGSPSHSTAMKTVLRPNTDELNPDGNNIVIEEEMSKVASNQAEYTKVLNLYGKTISMFKTAIGSSGAGG